MSGDGVRFAEFPHPPAAFLGLRGSDSGRDSLWCHALRGLVQHWRFADLADTVFVQVLAGGEVRLFTGLQRHLD